MARFGAAVSQHPVTASAVGEVVGQVLEAVGPEPDLAVLFLTGDHAASSEAVTNAVAELLGPKTLLGATATGAVGGPQEVEDHAAVVLWAGNCGDCVPVRLRAVPATDEADAAGWEIVGMPTDHDLDEPRVLVLLTDPMTFPVDAFVERLGERWPALRVVGGLASGAQLPRGNRLVLDGAVHTDGAVGVLLPAAASVRTVVSQGCRPIGEPLTVTRSVHNVVEELAGQPARQRLEQLVAAASAEERQLLAGGGVLLGVVLDERKETFTRGDFLVRTILGATRQGGGLVVGDEIAVGTTVQFQVRDAQTADEDLRLLLAGPPASAALVFTCNARGSRFFGAPDHDALAVHDATGRGAVAGMFCAGEIGPVGPVNHVHGYTASVLLFTD
jgi:small ligand-binding sensory domain FIST